MNNTRPFHVAFLPDEDEFSPVVNCNSFALAKKLISSGEEHNVFLDKIFFNIEPLNTGKFYYHIVPVKVIREGNEGMTTWGDDFSFFYNIWEYEDWDIGQVVEFTVDNNVPRHKVVGIVVGKWKPFNFDPSDFADPTPFENDKTGMI